MEEKIPCIMYNPQLWEYIKPYLKEWEYKIYDFANIKLYCLIVINFEDNLGHVANTSFNNLRNYNRELVTNVEEFLERAAKLKGFTYKRKNIMKINGIEIKPGMIIKTKEEKGKYHNYVVFPLLEGELGVIAYDKYSWDNIRYFIKNHSSDIISIHDLTSNNLGGLDNGKILWEKPTEVELTMQEIADKFGIPVKQLKIKK